MEELAIEEWKDVEGYEGYYQASNLGRIKSISRKRYNKNGGKPGVLKERILKQTKNGDGYYCVKLYKNGKSKSIKIHRIIADTFINNLKNDPEVNHKDGVKTNNKTSNLEWVTSKENVNHAYEMGLNPCMRDINIEKIIELSNKGYYTNQIAKKMNCDRKMISRRAKKYGIIIRDGRKNKGVNNEHSNINWKTN